MGGVWAVAATVECRAWGVFGRWLQQLSAGHGGCSGGGCNSRVPGMGGVWAVAATVECRAWGVFGRWLQQLSAGHGGCSGGGCNS